MNTQKYCTKCGKELPPNSKFCVDCGAAIVLEPQTKKEEAIAITSPARETKKEKKIMNYYLEVLKKYAVFTGRAQRAEYWYFFLFHIIISFVLVILAMLASPEGDVGLLSGIILALYTLYFWVVLIPGIAVSVRRLHDTNHSGRWLFIILVPIIGVIVLLVFMVRDSQPGANKYGPNPKEHRSS